MAKESINIPRFSIILIFYDLQQIKKKKKKNTQR